MSHNRRVLVTGGLGYIGSHTAVRLMECGFEVCIVDNLINSRIEVLDRIGSIAGKKPEFHLLDLRSKEDLTRFFENSRPFDSVIHFAALKSVAQSVKNPLLYYDNNVTSLVNLLKLVDEFRIGDFVFSSSCTVYGQPDVLPVNELEPFRPPASPYGETKQVAENLLQRVAGVSSLRVVSLRYFNPIGAHESAKIGEWPTDIPDNLVPYITQTAAGLRGILKVFGNDYSTHDGTAIRDYIHVVDLAEAHVMALDYLGSMNNGSFRAFNLGTGKGYTVLDVVNCFEKVCGIRLPLDFVGRRDGDVEQIYADPSLARKELKWVAARGLEEMIISSWKWQQELLRMNVNQ